MLLEELIGPDVSGDDAVVQGFSPTRRAMMFTVTDSLCRGNYSLKVNGAARVPLYYKALYSKRKSSVLESHPDWTLLHAHRDAMRYVGKRLTVHLWEHWTEA